MRGLRIALTAVLVSISSDALACDDHAPGTGHTKHKSGRESAWIAGQVREVDAEAGTITVGHEKIASLKMDAMGSMLIKARHPGLIARAKAGDQVKFRLALVGEEPILTRLVVVKTP